MDRWEILELLAPARRARLTTRMLEDRAGGLLFGAVALTLVAGGVYGAVLGSWHGLRLALYAGLKLPLVLLVTALWTLPFHLVVLRVGRARLGLSQAACLTLVLLAVAAVVLASVAPIVALFTAAVPPPSREAAGVHNVLYVFHTVAVGTAGIVGASTLRHVLRRLPPEVDRRTFQVAWLASYGLVGGEVAWVLRPFVGSVHAEVAFLRPDAFDGNVYEALWIILSRWLGAA